MLSKTFCPPSGPLSAALMIVGEQPGRDEALRTKQPFTGPAGKNLDECLQAARINRGDCYLTNVIKDFDNPLADYVVFTTHKRERRGSFSPSGEKYVTMLKEEIQNVQPNVIIACGNVALWTLCNRVGITFWRGSVLDSTLTPGTKVVPTLHPATWTQDKLWQNPEAFLNKYLVIMDLKRAKQQSHFREIVALERGAKIAPTYSEAIEFISLCEWLGRREHKTIYYDIETVPGTSEISCISLAYSPMASMCIPFIGPTTGGGQGDYFSIEQEATIMLGIAQIIENPHIHKGGQYLIFDSHLMYRKYGIIAKSLDDTFIAQKILYPEFPAGLDFITSMWTDMPYYKKDGKIWLGGEGTWEQGWIYNCKDSLSCADVFPQQRKELVEKNNFTAYERQRALIEPLTYMMEHGIKVDIEGMEAAKRCNTERCEELRESIYALMGQEMNLSSPQQLMQYFYDTKGISPYSNHKTGQPSVDVNALKRLATTHRLREASLLLELRSLEKMNSTFLNINKVDSDGRIRCAYNPAGTKFSRISSTENIFGTGINLQNVPHSALTFLKVDEGYIGYELDYSQFEARPVAYIGNIRPMIEVFEEGLDLHKMTAALVASAMGSATRYEDVTPEQRQDLGKRPNHAFNYGLGPNLFALMHELPQTMGKKIYTAYHMAYPGLAQGYWKYVQQQIKESRTLINLLGRKVMFLGKLDDSLWQSAYSCIPQGTCGDCINERGVNFVYYNSAFSAIELLTQVHDAIFLQIPLSVPLEEHARMLLSIRKEMEKPLAFQDRQFVPPVDLIINNCLNKEKGIELRGSAFSWDTEKLTTSIVAAATKLGILKCSPSC